MLLLYLGIGSYVSVKLGRIVIVIVKGSEELKSSCWLLGENTFEADGNLQRICVQKVNPFA